MSRTDSLLTVVISQAADLLARDPRIPHDARTAYRQHAEHVLRAQFAAVCGGERVYAPKVADVERMQMLVESPSRVGLQRMLAAWLPGLHELRARHKGLLRWAVDVDPLAI